MMSSPQTTVMGRGSLLRLVLLVLLADPPAAGQGPMEAAFVAENESMRARISDSTACCPRVVELQIVRNEERGLVRPLRLSGRIQQLGGLDLLVEDRLLLRGELPWGGDILVIANLRTMEQEETIEAYGFALSPNRRFLVYQTHYPRMVAPEARRSVFLLYDFSKSPRPNWIGEARKDWPEPNVGTPVFPEENVEHTSGDIFLGGNYHASSPFLWSPKSDSIVFVAQQNRGQEVLDCFVVRLEISSSGRVRQILKKPLVDALVDQALRKSLLEEKGEEPFCFGVEDLQWVETSPLREVLAKPYAGFSLPPKINLDVVW